MLGLLSHVLGLDNSSGSWYLFWSGFGGDLSEVAIIGGLYSLYQSRTCDLKGCHRLATVKVKDTDWTVCRKHAPTGRPSVADLADAFEEEVLPKDLPEKLDGTK